MYQTLNNYPAWILFSLSNHHPTSHLPLRNISKQHSAPMFLQLTGKTANRGDKKFASNTCVCHDSVECMNISWQSYEKKHVH